MTRLKPYTNRTRQGFAICTTNDHKEYIVKNLSQYMLCFGRLFTWVLHTEHDITHMKIVEQYLNL